MNAGKRPSVPLLYFLRAAETLTGSGRLSKM